ncbi:MAG: hypothetical protein HPY83_07480 [Anaerolineae bacterium]|nr:hypothetical protein [Anaerolineae bacterium]
MVQVEVGFDGSCPHDPAGVQELAPGIFRILPSWRPEPGLGEECLGRTTRLGFRAVNDSDAPTLAAFLIDWQYNDAPSDAPNTFASLHHYMQLRDFCVVRGPGSDQWRYLPLKVEGSVGRLELDLLPGVTEIHWHPPYSYAQGEEFASAQRGKPTVHAEVVGHSQEGRNIWLLRISDGNGAKGHRYFIRARAHGYESGGSYMVEGAVRFLTGESPWAAMARRDCEFFVLPMANPDGVHNGLSQLTAPRGSNLYLVSDERNDGAHAASLAAAKRAQPHWFIDFHNWQSKHSDGLLGLPPEQQERFLYYMDPIAPAGKTWIRRGPRPWPEGRTPESLSRFCQREYGTRQVAVELSWFGRSPEEARQFGERAMWAFLMMEYEKLPPTERQS